MLTAALLAKVRGAGWPRHGARQPGTPQGSVAAKPGDVTLSAATIQRITVVSSQLIMLVSTGVLVAFPFGEGRAGLGDLMRPRERVQPATASHSATAPTTSFQVAKWDVISRRSASVQDRTLRQRQHWHQTSARHQVRFIKCS